MCLRLTCCVVQFEKCSASKADGTMMIFIAVIGELMGGVNLNLWTRLL